jgi:hypothetical protein
MRHGITASYLNAVSWADGKRTEYPYSMHFYLLVLLICATPALLIIDGPIDHGVIPAILAMALAFAARTIRPGQAEHFFALARPVAIVAVIPAVWILVQILPLGIAGISNPIWENASAGIGHSIRRGISIDPGFTLLSLSDYFTMVAVLFLSMIACLDRQRAQWVLFALTTGTALTALILIGDNLAGVNFLSATANTAPRIGALDSAALGLILSSASAVGVFDRYESQRSTSKSSIATFAMAFVFCVFAFAACALAISLHPSGYLSLAAGSGLATLAAVTLIRRLGLGPWGCSAIGSVAIVISISVVALQPASQIMALTLPLAPQALISPSSVTERILAGSPWTGTGAGTFATLIPIYRDADDVVAKYPAPNVTTKIAVEAGRPAVWAVLFIAIASAVVLFRGALRRRRDSFYSAAGAGCVVTLILLSFTDAGMLQTPTSVVTSAALGLAFGQRLSRAIK